MRVIFGVGVGLYGKQFGGGEIPYPVGWELEQQAIALLTRAFGGVFVVRGEGAWMQYDGVIVRERGLQFTCDKVKGSDTLIIVSIARELRQLFKQDSVIVTRIKADITFIEDTHHASELLHTNN